jgi:hypothetical protein
MAEYRTQHRAGYQTKCRAEYTVSTPYRTQSRVLSKYGAVCVRTSGRPVAIIADITGAAPVTPR